MKRSLLVLALSAAFALAQPDRADRGGRVFQAVPAVFVGSALQCSPNPAGSNIVAAFWSPGIGLPDDGSPNLTPAIQPNLDPHFGLQLAKNGATADCSHARADITGVEAMPAVEFGYDILRGGHCFVTSPQIQVTTSDTVLHTAGCILGITGSAPQDPTQWTRVRHLPAAFTPPIAPGSIVQKVSIVVSDGTDVPGIFDTLGIGLTVLDNIDINGTLITRPPLQP